MGPSDAEITYEFHSALPLNDADAFFLGELAWRQLNHSTTVTIDVFKIVVLKRHWQKKNWWQEISGIIFVIYWLFVEN